MDDVTKMTPVKPPSEDGACKNWNPARNLIDATMIPVKHSLYRCVDGSWSLQTTGVTGSVRKATTIDELRDLLNDTSAGRRVMTDSVRERVARDWTPTAENVNALPEPLRRYVHDLQTRCDPAGDVRELTIARDTIRSLEALALPEQSTERKHENPFDEYRCVHCGANVNQWPDQECVERSPVEPVPEGPTDDDQCAQCGSRRIAAMHDTDYRQVKGAHAFVEVEPTQQPEPVALDGGMDQTFTVRRVLEILAEAAEHLLHDHDCDRHGHEVTRHARNAALRYLAHPPVAVRPAEELREALEMFSKDFHPFVEMARECTGNTNVHVILNKWEDVQDALATTPAQVETDG